MACVLFRPVCRASTGLVITNTIITVLQPHSEGGVNSCNAGRNAAVEAERSTISRMQSHGWSKLCVRENTRREIQAAVMLGTTEVKTAQLSEKSCVGRRCGNKPGSSSRALRVRKGKKKEVVQDI